MKPEKETDKHQIQLLRLTSLDEAPESHQGQNLLGLFSPLTHQAK